MSFSQPPDDQLTNCVKPVPLTTQRVPCVTFVDLRPAHDGVGEKPLWESISSALLNVLYHQVEPRWDADSHRFFLHALSLIPVDQYTSGDEVPGPFHSILSEAEDAVTKDGVLVDWLEPFLSMRELAAHRLTQLRSIEKALKRSGRRSPAHDALRGNHQATRGPLRKEELQVDAKREREQENLFAALAGAPLPAAVALKSPDAVADHVHQVVSTPLFLRLYRDGPPPRISTHATTDASRAFDFQGSRLHDTRDPHPPLIFVLCDTMTGLSHGVCSVEGDRDVFLRGFTTSLGPGTDHGGFSPAASALDAVHLLLRASQLLTTDTAGTQGPAEPLPSPAPEPRKIPCLVRSVRGDDIPPPSRSPTPVSSSTWSQDEDETDAVTTEQATRNPCAVVQSIPHGEVPIPKSSAGARESPLSPPGQQRERSEISDNSARTAKENSTAMAEAIANARAELGELERMEEAITQQLEAVQTCRHNALYGSILRFPLPGDPTAKPRPFQITSNGLHGRARSAPMPPTSPSTEEWLTTGSEADEAHLATSQPLRNEAFMAQLSNKVQLLASDKAHLERHAQEKERLSAERVRQAAVVLKQLQRVCQQQEISRLFAAEHLHRCQLEEEWSDTATALLLEGPNTLLFATATPQGPPPRSVEELLTDLVTTPARPKHASARRIAAVPSSFLERRSLEEAIAETEAKLRGRKEECEDVLRAVELQEQAARCEAQARQDRIDALEHTTLALRARVQEEEARQHTEQQIPLRALAAMLRAIPFMLLNTTAPGTREGKGTAPAEEKAVRVVTPCSQTAQGTTSRAPPSWSRLYVSIAQQQQVDPFPENARDAFLGLVRAAEIFSQEGYRYVTQLERIEGGETQDRACEAGPKRSTGNALPRPIHDAARSNAQTVRVTRQTTPTPSILLERVAEAFLSDYAIWQKCEENLCQVKEREDTLRAVAHEWSVVRRQVRVASDQLEALKDALECGDT